jgi:hypothetical protein
MKVIEFISNRYWLRSDSESIPKSISKLIPSWYRQADRFAKMPNGEYWVGPDAGKIPTWKACPALLDIMTTGYSLVTPCDITFSIDDIGNISAKVSDPLYQDFVTRREPMPQFEQPHGYYKYHFAWFPEWAIKVPSGYSVLYSSPFNRYDLPFMTVAGIIDNDKVNLPGSMPFFIKEGWTGVIPAGTPYAQMIPFLREDWKSQTVIPTVNDIIINNTQNSKKYRIPNGGVYKNSVWTKRSYE